MQSLVQTKDRFQSLLSCQSNLLNLESVLNDAVSADRLFLSRTLLLYFSDQLDPKLQNHLGTTLKYLLRMSWPQICPFQRHFAANFILLALQADRLFESELMELVHQDLKTNVDGYSRQHAATHGQHKLFGHESPILRKIKQNLKQNPSQESLLANPHTLQDVAWMLSTILDLQRENESLFVLQSVFQNFKSRPVQEWGRTLEILLILFEKGDDRMHVSFGLCFSELLQIHKHPRATAEIQLKCLQLIYLVIKTINWTDAGSLVSDETESARLESLLAEWVALLQKHLHSQSQAHTFFVFKIVDEIFKDQQKMTQFVAPNLLPFLTQALVRNLQKYLNCEVFSFDSEEQKDMESLFEYTFDEDQHYSNPTQAILIKFVDIVQGITFKEDAFLCSYLQTGSSFLMQLFFHLTMMNQEDMFLWKEEPNQYITEEDDETNLYALKPSVVSCLYSLIERFPQIYTQALVDLGDFHSNRFVRFVQVTGVAQTSHLFNPQSEIYDSLSKDSVDFLKNNSKFGKSQFLQQITKFMTQIYPNSPPPLDFFVYPSSSVSGASHKQNMFNHFTDLWKKMECTLFLVINFIKDIMTLDPGNQSKLGDYGKMCIELLGLGINDILTGRSIWAISTLKSFSSSDAEFLEIYSLVCQFLKPSVALPVRLCASRTVTRMSFKIASEQKQALVSQKVGEKMRDLHSWVLDLMTKADEKTFSLILDNFISFYDICPGLLSQEFKDEHAVLFLTAFKQNMDDGILSACFLQLFQKIAENEPALTFFWPRLVEFFGVFTQEALGSRLSGELRSEHKLENLGLVVDLLSRCGKCPL